MQLLLLIVPACLLAGVVVYVGFRYAGVFPEVERSTAPLGANVPMAERIPHGCMFVGVVAMVLWLIVWAVLFVIGLTILTR